MRTFRGMNLDPKFCTHGYATYTDEAGRVHVATGVRCSDVVPPAVAERARVAVRTLDRLVETQTVGIRASYELGWRDGYAASEEQHNRHYGRCADPTDDTIGCADPGHDHPRVRAPYGAPDCDCPLPEKVSETCPLHGSQHNAASVTDHRARHECGPECDERYRREVLGEPQHNADSGVCGGDLGPLRGRCDLPADHEGPC